MFTEDKTVEIRLETGDFATIGRLARRMKFAGVAIMVIASIFIVFDLYSATLESPPVAVWLLIRLLIFAVALVVGWMARSSGVSFDRMTDSGGERSVHLRSALGSLGSLFKTVNIVIILYIILTIAAIIWLAVRAAQQSGLKPPELSSQSLHHGTNGEKCDGEELGAVPPVWLAPSTVMLFPMHSTGSHLLLASSLYAFLYQYNLNRDRNPA